MINLRNNLTGEVMTVSNVSYNAKTNEVRGRYDFGTRFYNKYGRALIKIGMDGEQPILGLQPGWEYAGVTRKAQPEQPEASSYEAAPAAEAAQAVPSMDAAVQAFAALTPLFAGVQENVTREVMAKVQPLLDRVPQQVVHVIKVSGKPEQETGKVLHPNFDAVCARIAAGRPVYLYGPTGSGKNVLAEQVAEALGLKFYYQAHVLDRFELTGFIDANGNYQASEFYNAYTNGGLFMLDELDAADENALVTLNSACNGYFAFPCGTIKQHPDFRLIAAGNTCGRGATSDYTSRHVLDASSLGRFTPRYHGYCREIDMAAAEQDEQLVTFAEALRKVKADTGVQMLVSPRQLKAIKADQAADIDLNDSLRDNLTSYLTKDDYNIVCEALTLAIDSENNRYYKAFKAVAVVEY